MFTPLNSTVVWVSGFASNEPKRLKFPEIPSLAFELSRKDFPEGIEIEYKFTLPDIDVLEPLNLVVPPVWLNAPLTESFFIISIVFDFCFYCYLFTWILSNFYLFVK